MLQKSADPKADHGKRGLRGYYAEWWHFTLKDEPFPDSYFDIPIQTQASKNSKDTRHQLSRGTHESDTIDGLQE